MVTYLSLLCNMVWEAVREGLKEAVQDKKDKLVVAASGGVDSQTLLHVLAQEGFSVVVCVYFDHGLREDTVEDWRCVQEAALAYGYEAYKEDISEDLQGAGMENKARHRRYTLLEQYRQQHAASWTLTAHHGDDLLESQLLHCMRGSGLHGLVGIRFQDTDRHLLRPLLPVSKQDIFAYAQHHALTWHEDSTNASTDQARNALRHEVVPVLRRHHSDLLETSARLSQQAAEAVDFLTKTVFTALGDVYGTRQFSMKAFLKMDSVLQNHFLVLMERRWGHKYSQGFITTLCRLMHHGFASGRRVYLTSGRYLERSFDTVYVREADHVETPLSLPQNALIPKETLVRLEALTAGQTVRQYRHQEGTWNIWHTTVKKWRLKYRIPAFEAKLLQGLVDTTTGDVVTILHPAWTFPQDLPLTLHNL